MLRAYSGDDEAPPGLSDPACACLRRLGAIFRYSLHEDAFDGPVMRSLAAVGEYLRHQMSDLSQERFRVLHLDGENRLLADRVMWCGTVDRVQVHVREIVRDLMETNATALILAHNHPTGAVYPTHEDLLATTRIGSICRNLDVVLQDHVIVGRRGVFSMRANGMLDRPTVSRRSSEAERP